MESIANIINFVKVCKGNTGKCLASKGPHNSTGCDANLNERMMRSKLEAVC